MSGVEGRPRIVDFSTHLSGPLASYLLREFGADVIKVENPRGGDGLRGLEPMIAGQGKFHVGLNAGSRSLAVDARSEAWPRVVAACARWADAVIVGARPVSARERGLDFAALHAVSPELVYCAITGYGERGPWANYPAHGQNVDAMAGLVPVAWDEGVPVTPAGWRSAGSTLAGVFAALGVMAGLYRRALTGRGNYVSTSLWRAAMWWNWRDLNLLANNGHGSVEYQSFGSRYAMYGTSDGRVIIVCPIEEKFWRRFCDLLELPDAWRARGQWSARHADHGYDDERPVIAATMARRSLAEWIPLFESSGVPFAPVLTAQEAMMSAHASANHLMRQFALDGQSVSVVAGPCQVIDDPLDDAAPAGASPPPRVGEQTAELLAELGLGDLTDQLTA